MLKKLDKLIISSFISPMLMTFGISLFVLIMQFFWKYVDEIIGKGLSIWAILELVFYLSMTLVPMALPIAILISSVMVMGNFGERYELASMKSAGVSLLRIMSPLIWMSVLTMVLSFVSANFIIPYSNLKFQARLYDIRKQKPALSLQEGVFNNDFKGFTLRVGKKEKDSERLKDVSIYDQTPERRSENIQILAKEGEMYTTEDQKFMVLSLKNGKQYQDVSPAGAAKKNYPYIRTNFKEWEKVFDMSDFEMDKTNEELFKNHYQMMTGRDLLNAVDSLDKKIDLIEKNEITLLKPYFYFKKGQQGQDSAVLYTVLDSTGIVFQNISSPYQLIEKRKRETTRQQALTLARRIKEQAYSAKSNIERIKENQVEHWIWFHRKISFALVCFVFIFIGAPLGAIIRKGGFGWPMLIAIIGFMTFIVLFMTGEKLAKEQVVPIVVGMYLPVFVLLPLGMFLTYKALTDSKLLSMDSYAIFFRKVADVFKKLVKKKDKANGK